MPKWTWMGVVWFYKETKTSQKIKQTAMEPISTKKRPITRPPSSKLKHLDDDLLCIVFSFLDLVDLARCSFVCKTWSGVVNKSKLYDKWRQHKRAQEDKSWADCLEEMALDRHRLALEKAPVRVDHWRVHSVGVDQCRKKMGLLLTGVGDKVMRLWSLETYKCLGQYPIPDKKPLVDFDFDESKIVGLVGTHICIWRRNRIRSTFPMREDTFPKGLCMRYCDPDAVVGCIDGTARIFDMYSQRCSQVVKMHAGPVTCLCMSDDQLILTGSSYGSVAVSCVSSAQRIAEFRSTHPAGIRSVCFKPSSSHMLFAGSTDGYVFCWDVRSGRRFWETKVSPNVVYSMQHLRNDTSSLVVGGIDGVLRVLNQDTGEVVSRFVSEGNLLSSSRSQQVIGSDTVQRLTGRKLSPEASIDGIPRSNRPPITCVAVGMKNVITAHNNKYIRIWKFD